MANNFRYTQEGIKDPLERQVIAHRPGRIWTSLNLMDKARRQMAFNNTAKQAAKVTYVQMPTEIYSPAPNPSTVAPNYAPTPEQLANTHQAADTHNFKLPEENYDVDNIRRDLDDIYGTEGQA